MSKQRTSLWHNRDYLFLVSGQAIIGICWLTALILPLLAIAPNLIVLTLFFMLYLIWGRIMSVVNFSYRMALTPDEMRGRSTGIGSLLVRGSLPIGIALTGILVQNLGVVTTVLIISGCRLLIALAATLNSDMRNAPPAIKVQ